MPSSAYLQIHLRPERPHRTLLVLRGELDHVSADDVRAAVRRLAADGCEEVVLDLSGLSFMDAGGLHLLHGLRDGAAGLRCTMVDGSQAAARLLGLAGGTWPLPKAGVAPDGPAA